MTITAGSRFTGVAAIAPRGSRGDNAAVVAKIFQRDLRNVQFRRNSQAEEEDFDGESDGEQEPCLLAANERKAKQQAINQYVDADRGE